MAQVATVARHTIQEAIKLTGKSRRTLYRLMDSGQLSYDIERDKRRYFDTSELMRVFGQIGTLDVESVPKTKSQEDVQNDLLTQLIEEVKKQADDIRQLRKENAAQTEQLEAINKQLEARPLLEAPKEVEPAIVSDSNEPPVSTGKSEYSGIIQRMKDRQKA